ncbi:MAG TPA: flagellin [Candidatus Sulfotelmatobacter sp.]|nr:flagellin [Candidatus Sulfotelmatobacter sp.]
MAISLLNNIAALEAQNQLQNTQNNLQNTLYQLSSGSRINSGADDAAGLAIANGMQANITALNQSQANANNGVGMLQTADGALAQVTTLLNRAVTLATESANGTLNGDNGTQRTALDAEYTQIKAEISSIGANTTFNGTAIFQGSSANSLQSQTTSTLSATSSLGATAGQLVIDVGGQKETFATAANETLGTLMNAINTSNTGLEATVQSGKFVVTDLQNRGDIALDGSSSGTVLTTLQGAGTVAMASPVDTQANTNELQFATDFSAGGTGTVLDSVEGNAGNAEPLVLDVGGKTYTFDTTAGTTTVGDLMNQINSGTDSSGNATDLRASLQTVGSTQLLTVQDLGNNGDIAMDSTSNATLQADLGGQPVNPQTPVTQSGLSVFLSDSTSIGTNTINVSIGALAANNIGGVDITQNTLETQAGAEAALTQINTAISNIAAMRGNIGAGINRLQAASNVESAQVQNLTSAEDQIMAANVPQQVTNLSEYSILEQSGISALAQANSAQQSILKLLQ